MYGGFALLDHSLLFQGNPISCLKKNASQDKLSVSFLLDLNKHNVYRGIKLINNTEINFIDADVDVGTNATTRVLLKDSDVRPVYMQFC